MNPLALVKNVITTVVSIGVGTIVGNVVKQSTPADAKIVQKICVGVGSFVLSCMVGGYASKYAEEETVTTIEQIKVLKAAFHQK